MKEQGFEEALRSTLRAAAPLDVPVGLESRARAIPSAIPVQRGWWTRVSPPRIRAALGAVLVAAVRRLSSRVRRLVPLITESAPPSAWAG